MPCCLEWLGAERLRLLCRAVFAGGCTRPVRSRALPGTCDADHPLRHMLKLRVAVGVKGLVIPMPS